ncbi:trimeric intracellular cation channel family protein [Ornithobacterium rhinotracheale]|uniref:Putative membrane protein n=1 Tax=Ornithobacterium rhinotracheale (strain ATCC 51463 / DSM 15997 / CCUG 23171 / CIP 104009 / LMG 9086) TaxID=867902 RepID=I3ZXH8_ORNRL|nr:trimeric intracellular cation channel family protein [Ornithobacterium rhinotracheale]AFL96412.1 putative membrane protein [Ornithobacterium rhinotracheale DSM 15997]AIP98628.1 membrane protein [Ornithobacterium rhinotracheale ORT-UMN 88]KGB67628.1 membrane protein [Ornithobacterium rhinotracheale H06-030791]MCK0194740.1 trimeric intracellular cation channel family protein [Ornithobacterium rhinotracheale]MCK0200793.1 trimeric intracellular cation channel family protein [Ornithobacterium rh
MFFSPEISANVTLFIEIVGTISFAMSGAFAAMQSRLDPFGVLIIAFATAVGGGTIRDLLLDVPVFWMTDLRICLITVLSCAAAMFFKSLEHNFKVTLFVFDSLGLGLFTIVGLEKGLVLGFSPLICVALGTITGCFGGLLRDVLINRIPLLLREEIYAIACIIGAFLYLLLAHFFGLKNPVVQLVTVLVVFGIRHFSIKYHWHIPLFYLSSEQKMKAQFERMKKLKPRKKK